MGSEAFWKSLRGPNGKSNVETFNQEEKDVFKMPIEEWEQLRFRITNQTMRLAECYNHPKGIAFGFRLHPPHLWNIIDGVLFKKVKGKWVKFVPDVEDNLERFRNRG